MFTKKAPKVNEAEIQAEFYHQAKLAGLKCRIELVTIAGRLDVAIVSKCGKGIVFCVEIKRGIGLLCPRQLMKYRDATDVNVLTFCRMKEIPGLIERIKRDMPQATMSPWARFLKL